MLVAQKTDKHDTPHRLSNANANVLDWDGLKSLIIPCQQLSERHAQIMKRNLREIIFVRNFVTFILMIHEAMPCH